MNIKIHMAISKVTQGMITTIERCQHILKDEMWVTWWFGNWLEKIPKLKSHNLQKRDHLEKQTHLSHTSLGKLRSQRPHRQQKKAEDGLIILKKRRNVFMSVYGITWPPNYLTPSTSQAATLPQIQTQVGQVEVGQKGLKIQE